MSQVYDVLMRLWSAVGQCVASSGWRKLKISTAGWPVCDSNLTILLLVSCYLKKYKIFDDCKKTKWKHLLIASSMETFLTALLYHYYSWVQMYPKGLEGIRKSEHWDPCIGWNPAGRLRPLRLLAELWLYWFISPVWWNRRFSSTVSALLPMSLHVWTYEYCYVGRRGRPAP